MEEETKELAVFLKFATDPKGVLLLALLHAICERFPEDLEKSPIILQNKQLPLNLDPVCMWRLELRLDRKTCPVLRRFRQ